MSILLKGKYVSPQDDKYFLPKFDPEWTYLFEYSNESFFEDGNEMVGIVNDPDGMDFKVRMPIKEFFDAVMKQ